MTDDQYDLVMPFVLCQSNGGPYDDAAFVAGFSCAKLDTALRELKVWAVQEWVQYLSSTVMPQVDLIAMHHG